MASTTQGKFHINHSGDVGKCTASNGRCPFGGAESHFRTKDEAEFYSELNSGQIAATILPGLDSKGNRVAAGTGLLIRPTHQGERAKIKTRRYWFPLPDSNRVVIGDTETGREYTAWVQRGHPTISVEAQVDDAVKRGAFDYESSKPEGTYTRERLGVDGGYREIADAPKPVVVPEKAPPAGPDWFNLGAPEPSREPAGASNFNWMDTPAAEATPAPAVSAPVPTAGPSVDWLAVNEPLPTAAGFGDWSEAVAAAPRQEAPVAPKAQNRLFSRVLGNRRQPTAPVQASQAPSGFDF